LRNTDEE
jgi:chromosome segregation ATPase